jgi:hypothetical protein
MGDKARAEVFATFIWKEFPEAVSIADVAGGHGDLSYWLAIGGRAPTIVDPRAARFPKWIQRDLRKRRVRGERTSPIRRLVARVEDVDLREFDLVVALHPDQATEPTILGCLASGVDFAIVPCCVFPIDQTRYTQEGWVNYLVSLAPGTRCVQLPIRGANTAIFSRAAWREPSLPGRP